MKNTPKIIYLQVGDVAPDTDFNELAKDAITWSEEQINKTDIKYVVCEPKEIRKVKTNYFVK